jgi:hypothetical protein
MRINSIILDLIQIDLAVDGHISLNVNGVELKQEWTGGQHTDMPALVSAFIAKFNATAIDESRCGASVVGNVGCLSVISLLGPSVTTKLVSNGIELTASVRSYNSNVTGFTSTELAYKLASFGVKRADATTTFKSDTYLA